MEEALFQVQKKGKVGFINNSGQVVIDFEFDSVSDFSEGLARVYYKKKVGCINTKGNLVIPIKYEDMREFSDGLAVVEIKGGQGYIDRTGHVVIPPKFHNAGSFQNGFALVENPQKPWASFINKSGEIVLTNRVHPLSRYNEGLINCNDNEKWGYMNISGEMVIEPVFEDAHPFYEGKAAVVPAPLKGEQEGAERSYGFIDKSGNMVIPPIYGGADLKFSEDLCAVHDDNGFGYLKPTGELVIPYQFYLGDHFSEGMACVQFTEEGKYGFINKEGAVTIPPIFDIADAFKNGLAAVCLGKKTGKTLFGYINKNGDYVWEPSK
jgi:hypothetical protein